MWRNDSIYRQDERACKSHGQPPVLAEHREKTITKGDVKVKRATTLLMDFPYMVFRFQATMFASQAVTGQAAQTVWRTTNMLRVFFQQDPTRKIGHKELFIGK